MTQIVITKIGDNFEIDQMAIELPESIAGMENIHDVRFVNNTGYNLSEIKIWSERNDVQVKHPQTLQAGTDVGGQVVFACPKSEDEPFATIPLKITAIGRKAANR